MEKYLQKMSKEEMDVVKGLLVPDNVGTRASLDVLPKPIADEVVRQVVEKNYMRTLFKVYKIAKDSLTLPTWTNDNTNVYQVTAAGGNASSITQNSPAASSVVLQPGKLAAKTYITKDDVRDASYDVIDLVLESLAEATARAEERAMLIGTKDRASSTATAVCNGLFTIANSGSLCTNTAISFTSATDYAIHKAIAEGIKTLGVYGREPLVLIASPDFVYRLRTDKVNFVEASGAGNSLQTGKLPRYHGVEVFESTYATAYKAVLVPRTEPRIGVGRDMELAVDDEVGYDRFLYVLFNKFDMVLPHQTSSKADAIVGLTDTNT